MPGRSAACSRTTDRMVASCSSPVGGLEGEPLIILALAARAKRRGAAVYGVGRDQPGGASPAGLAAAAVRVQLQGERAALSPGVAVIPEAGASGFESFAKYL